MSAAQAIPRHASGVSPKVGTTPVSEGEKNANMYGNIPSIFGEHHQERKERKKESKKQTRV
jgi:hypothetical protein